MVHLRINEREANPNPHVNFLAVLPMADATVEEATRQLLRALAAQVKPIMKAHGFAVNSLEEYEYNHIFAGRNWNHGETIELVLRSSTGSLVSTHWLMSVLCHELAHIKHMDHGPAFHALWRQLQQEVRALQNRGYYGDGYWSSGTRLVDSARIAGQGIEMGDLPEYMCGGAHSRTRPISHRPHKSKGPQTSKKRKAGSRVTSSAFSSVGKALNEDLEGNSKTHGIGFRKKAGSKRAKEERALAAEQRIRALQGKESPSDLSVVGDDSESEDEKRDFETDNDRRRTLLEVIAEKDLDALKATAFDPAADFLMPTVGLSGEFAHACGVEEPRESSTTTAGSMSGGLGQTRTSLHDEASGIRPSKKRKTSQSKLIFTSHSISGIPDSVGKGDSWDCMVCTLTNEPNHLACSACCTPRGELRWVGDNQVPL